LVYEVRLQNFEGPLDLLLHLIKKNDINIYDIPISQITSEYISYLDMMRRFNLNLAGDFLIMASTLIKIKSRMLLPQPQGDNPEEEDPRKELMDRLLEYKKVKAVSQIFRDREHKQSQLHGRPIYYFKEDYYTVEATVFDIMDAFSRVISSMKEDFREIIQEEVSVEEKIMQIENMLEEKEYILLSEIFSQQKRKLDIIAFLLALLEMIKMKRVCARQSKIFGEIRIYRVQPKVLDAVPG